MRQKAPPLLTAAGDTAPCSALDFGGLQLQAGILPVVSPACVVWPVGCMDTSVWTHYICKKLHLHKLRALLQSICCCCAIGLF